MHGWLWCIEAFHGEYPVHIEYAVTLSGSIRKMEEAVSGDQPITHYVSTLRRVLDFRGHISVMEKRLYSFCSTLDQMKDMVFMSRKLSQFDKWRMMAPVEGNYVEQNI